MAQRHNFRGRRAWELFRELLGPIGTVKREATPEGVDFSCGDHVWRNVGVHYGAGAELQMGNISENPFRGAFFGLIVASYGA